MALLMKEMGGMAYQVVLLAGKQIGTIFYKEGLYEAKVTFMGWPLEAAETHPWLALQAIGAKMKGIMGGAAWQAA